MPRPRRSFWKGRFCKCVKKCFLGCLCCKRRPERRGSALRVNTFFVFLYFINFSLIPEPQPYFKLHLFNKAFSELSNKILHIQYKTRAFWQKERKKVIYSNTEPLQSSNFRKKECALIARRFSKVMSDTFIVNREKNS